MKVDGFRLLVDLAGIRISAVGPASLTDPTIKRVEWGPVQLANGETVAASGVTTPPLGRRL
jgi:hypothetical protein